jgi:hypothetical protein
MQKITLQRAGETAVLAATAVLYFAAIAMFSFAFTQN